LPSWFGGIVVVVSVAGLADIAQSGDGEIVGRPSAIGQWRLQDVLVLAVLRAAAFDAEAAQVISVLLPATGSGQATKTLCWCQSRYLRAGA
jgi:hypothetical protein